MVLAFCGLNSTSWWSCHFLTGSALGVLWIKFPRVRIWLALLIFLNPRHVIGHWPVCGLAALGVRFPQFDPSAELREENDVGLPGSKISVSLSGGCVCRTDPKALILTVITCSFSGMCPYFVCLKIHVFQRSVTLSRWISPRSSPVITYN